ncbi:MAG TPA: glycosyltransferase family 9 protein [Desulfobacterales bacterium]|nr:glycosyltransferase family 9 protein [Desulfobacterales bacterium]
MAAYYRAKWADLRQAPEISALAKLARQIAYSFLDHYLQDCRYEEEYIELLCEMTTAFEDQRCNDPAAQALFGIIIERLCDDFEELQTLTYNRVMAQVIAFCRGTAAGRSLDRQLSRFGIFSTADLAERITRIRTTAPAMARLDSIGKVLLLSRVTVGADVAISSIVIQRLLAALPAAEIVIIGSKSAREIYGANPRVRLREIPYARRGGLLQRLAIWHEVLAVIQGELAECPLEQTVLLDPDSRLSQLGVLPLIAPERYFFLDTRSDAIAGSAVSMAEITNAWLDRLLGERRFSYPRLWLPRHTREKALAFCAGLRAAGARRIVSLNFGVGGNRRKRVGPELEHALLRTLLAEPGTVILLDKGFGEEEVAAAEALLAHARAAGHATGQGRFETLAPARLSWGMIAIENSIGQIAALIAASDEFIGYDSACQHIAAAVGTPCLTIFAGSNNTRFIRRWSAQGPQGARIVHVDTLSDPAALDVGDIISRIQNERRLNGRKSPLSPENSDGR